MEDYNTMKRLRKCRVDMSNLKLQITALLLIVSMQPLLSQTVLETKRDSLKLLLDIAAGEEKVDLFNELSGTLYRLNPRQALDYADSAQALSMEIRYSKGEIDAIINNGSANFYLGNYSTTYEKYKKAESRISKLETPLEYSFILYRLAIVQRKRGFFNESLKLAEESLSISRSYNDTISIAKTLNVMGLIYWNMERFDEAIKVNIETQKLVKDKYPSRYAMSLSNTALIYYSLGDHEKAIELNLQALPIKEKRGDLKGIRNSFNNIALSYSSLGQNEKSLEYQFKALELDKQMDNTMEMARAMDNIGKTYLDLNRPLDAKPYIEESYKLRRNQPENYDLAEITKNMGVLNYKLRNYSKAEEFLREAVRISDACDCIEKHAMSYKHLSTMYKEQGKYKNALDYYVLYRTYEDSIVNENVRNQISELETKYETEKKEQEIVLLNQEKELQAASLENEKFLRNSFIGISITIIIALFFLYKISRERKLNLAKLSEKNVLIAKQKDELDDLNKMKDKFFSVIAHDLRGPVGNMMRLSKLVLLNSKQKDDEENIKISSLLNESSKSINSLLQSLLLWGKVQMKVATPVKSDYYIHSRVNEAIKIYQERLTGKKINIKTDVNNSHVVYVDEGMIDTVFRNLIHNAIKFSNENSEIRINSIKENDFVNISVIDNGIGIDKQVIDEILNPNSNQDKAELSNKKSGLGLILANEFVALNSGEMSIESEIGKGTTVTFSLPAKEVS